MNACCPPEEFKHLLYMRLGPFGFEHYVDILIQQPPPSSAAKRESLDPPVGAPRLAGHDEACRANPARRTGCTVLRQRAGQTRLPPQHYAHEQTLDERLYRDNNKMLKHMLDGQFSESGCSRWNTVTRLIEHFSSQLDPNSQLGLFFTQMFGAPRFSADQAKKFSSD